MLCRRCNGSRLVKLAKKLAEDNDVFRCEDCGFIFSPLEARKMRGKTDK